MPPWAACCASCWPNAAPGQPALAPLLPDLVGNATAPTAWPRSTNVWSSSGERDVRKPPC